MLIYNVFQIIIKLKSDCRSDSTIQFTLKSPIIMFCEEESSSRIVRRAESRRDNAILGVRYNPIMVRFGSLSVLMIVISIPLML